MTRTTTPHHEVANHELSASAALRALRNIAYRDWDAYQPFLGVRAARIAQPETFEAFEAFEAESFELETDGVEAPPVVLVLDEPDVPRPTWYLNEVPAEWLVDTCDRA